MRAWYIGLFARANRRAGPVAATWVVNFTSAVAGRWRARRCARLQPLDFAFRPGFALRLLRLLPMSFRLQQHFRSTRTVGPAVMAAPSGAARWMVTHTAYALQQPWSRNAAQVPPLHHAERTANNAAPRVLPSAIAWRGGARGQQVERVPSQVVPVVAAAAKSLRRRAERIERMASPPQVGAAPLLAPARSADTTRAEARARVITTSARGPAPYGERAPGSTIFGSRAEGISFSALPARLAHRIARASDVASALRTLRVEKTTMQRFERTERRLTSPPLAPAPPADDAGGGRDMARTTPMLRRRPSSPHAPSAAALAEMEAAIAVKIERRMERRIADVVEESLAPDSGYARKLMERAYADLHDGILLERERLG